MRIDGSRRLLIVGKTGSGKSFLARFLLKQMADKGYRIVIVDPKIDWMVEKKTASGLSGPTARSSVQSISRSLSGTSNSGQNSNA